jgi:hypothetical protein
MQVEGLTRQAAHLIRALQVLLLLAVGKGESAPAAEVGKMTPSTFDPFDLGGAWGAGTNM